MFVGGAGGRVAVGGGLGVLVGVAVGVGLPIWANKPGPQARPAKENKLIIETNMK